MTTPRIASREEWMQARLDLLAQEKEHTRQKDRLAAARRALPWVEVDRDYRFETTGGAKSLRDLFGPRRQLIVQHFMFGRDWENACKSCSFWADGYDGLVPHLNARDIAFVVVSSAPLERLQAFRARMGWDVEWVSSHGSRFNYDFDVGFGEGRPDDLSPGYNFGAIARPQIDELPGISVFALGEGGAVYHTYSTYGRGLDAMNAAYAYIDLTPMGRNEPSSGNPMGWLEYRDSY